MKRDGRASEPCARVVLGFVVTDQQADGLEPRQRADQAGKVLPCRFKLADPEIVIAWPGGPDPRVRRPFSGHRKPAIPGRWIRYHRNRQRYHGRSHLKNADTRRPEAPA